MRPLPLFRSDTNHPARKYLPGQFGANHVINARVVLCGCNSVASQPTPPTGLRHLQSWPLSLGCSSSFKYSTRSLTLAANFQLWWPVIKAFVFRGIWQISHVLSQTNRSRVIKMDLDRLDDLGSS